MVVMIERYLQIVAEHNYRDPSSRPSRWRVSRDEWDALEAAAMDRLSYRAEAQRPAQSLLLGLPITPDDELSPRSIVLECASV